MADTPRLIRCTGLLAAVVLLFAFSIARADAGAALDALFAGMIKNDTTSGVKVLAILPFTVSSSTSDANAGLMVAEYAITSFHKSGLYTIVDRSQLEKVMGEIALSQSGVGADQKTLEVGKLLVADRIVSGTITSGLGKEIVAARIIDVATGGVIASGSVSVPGKDLSAFAAELAGEVKVSGALVRSLILPGWGQFYTKHPVHGTVSLLAVAGLGAGTIFYGVKAGDAETEALKIKSYIETQQNVKDAQAVSNGDNVIYQRFLDSIDARKAQLDKDYSDTFDRAVLFGILTGAAWALNIVDAAIVGKSAGRKAKLYFSGVPCSEMTLGLQINF